ncbi:MAG TPA: zinc-binding dehydrogenase [Longimicrobiales bacterium]
MATLVQPGRFEVGEGERVRAGAGEVVVRVEGCGVCASNLGPWEGVEGVGYPMEPGAPGHEVYGVVEEVGEGVAGVAPGDAVTALSYRGFAEYDVARADAVVKVPEALAGRPILGEPVACAVNVHRRAGVREGDTVVVVGIGFLGALLLRLVRRDRPERVVAVSRRREALAMAERMGADEVLRYDDDVTGRVAAWTGGRMADVVIEATGKQAPLDLAAALTRVRGRLVIAGYHQDGPRQVNLQLWNWRGIDVINAHEREPALYTSGMEDAVSLIAGGELEPDALVTHTFLLSEIDRAFEVAQRRPEGFFKAVVVPGEGR